jgi:solute carrier family 13 (sodium-dependent dicarboxylate transporter), member 2/3/5
MITAMLPVELEIELFCRGARIDASCDLDRDARRIARTRAGLGSGLEIILPSPRKEIWLNVPVVEWFAAESPLVIAKRDGTYVVRDERDGADYPMRLPQEPEWYARTTTSGVEMSRIGVLQGNYLGIYVQSSCMYWASGDACRFCTTGKNVGTAEESRKRVEDVIEVARAAQAESGSVFTHLNTGYHYEDVDSREAIHGTRQCLPYVKAIRQQVGGFIGVQAMPVPRHNYHHYDELIEAGTDHFSFCYEFEEPETFERICPGKARTHGQKSFFDAMEYTAGKLGRGRVSGEIIAGLEPVEATKRGIDRIVAAGAFPTVCIFRPTEGSALERERPPEPEAMKEVFAHVHEACRNAGLPVGVLPIEVSLVVQPEETIDLVEPNLRSRLFDMKNGALKRLARPYVAWKMKPRPQAA